MRIKRLTAILLCLCMALTLLPATAWAADGETIHVGGVTLTGSADTPAYAKTDNSGNVTVESAREDDYNLKWDGTTLTLDNANISGGYGFSGSWDSGSAAIYYSGGSDISLILTGENTVTGPNGDNNASFGIYACGDSGNIIDFTISGSGSLTATGGDMVSESYGIFTDNLIVQSGTVNAAGGNGNTVKNSYGIYVYIYLTISGGTVTAEGSTQAVFNNTGDIIVVPARDRQIAVTAGEDASSAVAVTGSPFTRKTTITDLISDAEYFHSEVTEATDPNPNPDPGDPDDPGGDDDPEPNICVGGVGLTGDKDTPAYALTDKNGTVTKDSATADNYNIMWDGETLTLRNATISGGNVFDGDKSAAIYYIQESPLNLMLVGDNAVTGPSGEGIEKSYGISACGTDDYIDLTISGAGTLTATLYASWDRHDSGDSSDHPARPSRPSAPSYAVSTVDADNGEVDVDLSRVQAGEEVTITVTPDEGYEVEAVTVTDRDGEEINVTEAGDGVYTFEMPNSRVTIEVTFAPVAEEPEPPAVPDGWANPYGDVAANAWYYDAVAYVSASGMMTGTNAAAFSPDAATTRAMIWTVLARLNGQSVDGGSPWYAAAQSWAVSAGISDGTDPAGNITREALAAMLYRAAGSPAVSGNFLAFSDGDSVSSWAESAMLWATQSGIIGGIDGALAPQGQATRAQVAAMLQRFMESGGLGAE